MAAPAQTTPDAHDPSASADPIALAAFVARRGGRVLAYLDAVTTPERALHGTGEAFATFRLARAADPDAEAPATALLRATRRAATACAENPYRPEGRERPARRTKACDAMPRLLVAWTEGRLPDGDVERLVHHLQECPDCRALRDAFDRAELGYRGGESVELDGTEVGVVAAAMALAVPAADEAVDHARPDTAPAPRRGRTSLPGAPPTADDPSLATPVGRRTAIPEPPVLLPELAGRTAVPPARTDGRTQVPTARGTGRTAVPEGPGAGRGATPSADIAPTAPARDGGESEPATTGPRDRTPAGDDRGGATATSGPRPAAQGPVADEAVDPLGPEALGYAVPRTGLPRPARRPARPRVRRRRRRAGADAATDVPVVAGGRTDTAAERDAAPDGTAGDRRDGDGDAVATAVLGSVAPRTDDADAPPAPRDRTTDRDAASDRDAPAARDTASVGATSPDRDRPDRETARTDESEPDPAPPTDVGHRAEPAVVVATSGRGLTRTGRRVLEIPIVRQLGVPAVLLLAVLIAALIAAGAFSGRDDSSVTPVPRPTIPTVPSNANQIPPLP